MDDNLPVVINPQYFSDAVKHQCFILYCNGSSPRQISDSTSVPNKVINKWVWDEDWPSLRDEVKLKYKDLLVEHSAIDILGTQAKHVRLSRLLQQFVEEEMLSQLEERTPKKRFRTWTEMSQVLQTGINIEKQAAIGNVEEEFVLKLLQAIKKADIPDEYKGKIVEEIRSVFSG